MYNSPRMIIFISLITTATISPSTTKSQCLATCETSGYGALFTTNEEQVLGNSIQDIVEICKAIAVKRQGIYNAQDSRNKTFGKDTFFEWKLYTNKNDGMSWATNFNMIEACGREKSPEK